MTHLRNTSFENWRLSRIEEELERLSFSSQDTSADDGSCSPRSAEGTLERRAYAKGGGSGSVVSGSQPTTGKDDEIYSKAGLETNSRDSLQKEEDSSKDALRFIKEKYDSLGKVKVRKPCVATDSDQSVGDHQMISEGASECGGCVQLLVPPTYHHQSSDSAHRNVPLAVPGTGSIQIQSHETMSVYQDHRKSSTEDEAAGGIRVLPGVQTRGGTAGRSRSSSSMSEQELMQVEMFYKSHKTSVFVCLCQASLFLSDPIRNSLCPVRGPSEGTGLTASAIGDERNRHPEPLPPDNWTFVKSGIPVLVLDSGESRRQRRLHLVLAERGTGFGLWKDTIDYLSDYSAPSMAFHTLHLSNDHSKLVGLRFEDAASAAEFLQHIRRLTSDADDPLLNLAATDDRKAKKSKKSSSAGGSSSAESAKRQKGKSPVVTKADISLPCCFTHITKLDRSDGSNLLRGQSASPLLDCKSARNSPRPSSGSAAERHKVKLKP